MLYNKRAVCRENCKITCVDNAHLFEIFEASNKSTNRILTKRVAMNSIRPALSLKLEKCNSVIHSVVFYYILKLNLNFSRENALDVASFTKIGYKIHY